MFITEKQFNLKVSLTHLNEIIVPTQIIKKKKKLEQEIVVLNLFSYFLREKKKNKEKIDGT